MVECHEEKYTYSNLPTDIVSAKPEKLQVYSFAIGVGDYDQPTCDESTP